MKTYMNGVTMSPIVLGEPTPAMFEKINVVTHRESIECR